MALIDSFLGPAVGAAALTAAATFVINAILTARNEKKNKHGLTIALRAEIKERRRAQEAFVSGTSVSAVKAAMDEDPDYVPFTTSDPDFSRAIYNDLRKDVAVLDEKTLELVVRFYVEDNLTQTMITDLRSKEFKALSAVRKKAYLDLLIAQANETVEAGDDVLKSLERSLSPPRLGDPANIGLRRF